MRGQLVGSGSLRGERGNAHQIRTRQARVIWPPEVLVQDHDLPFGRGQAGEHQQAERLPNAIPVPTITLGRYTTDQRFVGLIR